MNERRTDPHCALNPRSAESVQHAESARGKVNAGNEALRRALWEAFRSGARQLDGQVFVGVSSTGIYCRPVCSAHMPKFGNCTFFHSAAQAEAAGYRPCMVCRPEIAPGNAPVDARQSLARRAAAMISAGCTAGDTLERIAERLGYTDRHLRRAFETELHVSPGDYLRTCRLLLAKTLLTDTQLPIAQVAFASGFTSVRRFNQVFKDRYRMTPSALRKRKRRPDSRRTVSNDLRKTARTPGSSLVSAECGADASITLRLGYRPPYPFAQLLSFYRMRTLAGVEAVDDSSYARAIRLVGPSGEDVFGWMRIADAPRENALAVTLSESLAPALSQVISRVRRQFDLDCHPETVHRAILGVNEFVPGAAVLGTRLPGAFEPFEIAVRAVLGQQISVKAANTLAARIAQRYGAPVETGVPGLERTFPTAQDVLALNPIEDALGVLGVTGARSRTIREIARLCVAGELDLGAGAVVADQMERLLAIKGIGRWSANYITMRALGNPDAFLETDAGIKHALPDYTPAERRTLAEAWRPWRSYANICLWNSLG